MLKTLPYNALRTLEAVVRLRGFGRAADELNVTQSAVSQHIKQLEDWLGHQLLIRQSPHTLATEYGEQLARAVRDGFGPIAGLCDEMRTTHHVHKHRVLVAAPPGFAFVWLLPRLLDFDNTYPDTPVSLSTDPKSQNPAISDADVIISYATGGFPNMHAEPLMTEQMAPVCAPELATHLTSITDLANHVILEDVLETPAHEPNWSFWAKEVGVSLPTFPRHRKFGQANLVIQAAISGSGIAMGRGPLVEDAIAAGVLVHPFPDFAQSQFSYWFVCKHTALKSKSVQAFHSWIKTQTARPPAI